MGAQRPYNVAYKWPVCWILSNNYCCDAAIIINYKRAQPSYNCTY